MKIKWHSFGTTPNDLIFILVHNKLDFLWWPLVEYKVKSFPFFLYGGHSIFYPYTQHIYRWHFSYVGCIHICCFFSFYSVGTDWQRRHFTESNLIKEESTWVAECGIWNTTATTATTTNILGALLSSAMLAKKGSIVNVFYIY